MTDEPAIADLADLVRMLDAVSDRIDALAGEDAGARENRTIRQSRAQLARDGARQVRAEVQEVRRHARELARQAGSARDGSTVQATRIAAGGTGDPGVLAAVRAADVHRKAPDRESGRAQRLVEQARGAVPGVCWAQLAVPEGSGIMAWSAGELSPAAVAAVESGPRAAVLRDADVVRADGHDDTWPVPTGVAGVLAVRLGRGTVRGALVLVGTGADTFDDDARLVAALVAEHATTVLTGGGPHADHAADARDTLAGARAVVGRHLGVDTDATFDVLLDTARIANQPVLTVAHRLLATLVPRTAEVDVVTGEPTSLRRAVAYMDRHALDPIHVDDVASESGIGVRGLQNLFRLHRGITPLTYLRTVRLERAHAELQAARPTSGITVNTVAARWHFTNPGRFSAIYRERFGVLPSHTLRT